MRSEKRKRRVLQTVCGIFLAGIVFCIGSLLASRYGLCVSDYTIAAKVTSPVRIVQLTDVHNAEFGKDNVRLVEKVRQQNPDLIVLTGDMINKGTPDVNSSIRLIRALAEIAPVYASYGNHEDDHEKRFGSDFHVMWKDCHVLDDTWEEVTVNGQKLRIGGYYGYMPDPSAVLSEAYVFMDLFTDVSEDTVSVLLCHMPASFLEWGALDKWSCDLIFAGHAHGGQIRLPFIGGLTAPDQGWFPGRLCGVYRGEQTGTTMILSRGLGAGEHLPRLNNIPEIVVCDLVPAA